MRRNYPDILPEGESKSKTKVISKNKTRNKAINDADLKNKSRLIQNQRTVVNVTFPGK